MPYLNRATGEPIIPYNPQAYKLPDYGSTTADLGKHVRSLHGAKYGGVGYLEEAALAFSSQVSRTLNLPNKSSFGDDGFQFLAA